MARTAALCPAAARGSARVLCPGTQQWWNCGGIGRLGGRGQTPRQRGSGRPRWRLPAWSLQLKNKCEPVRQIYFIYVKETFMNSLLSAVRLEGLWGCSSVSIYSESIKFPYLFSFKSKLTTDDKAVFCCGVVSLNAEKAEDAEWGATVCCRGSYEKAFLGTMTESKGRTSIEMRQKKPAAHRLNTVGSSRETEI